MKTLLQTITVAVIMITASLAVHYLIGSMSY